MLVSGSGSFLSRTRFQKTLSPSTLFRARFVLCCVCSGLLASGLGAQAQNGKRAESNEQRTARRLDDIRNAPASLRSFLMSFPKGADLHMHLSGAIYAETFLRDAADDNLCVDPVKLVLLPNVGETKSIPPKPVCAEGTEAAAAAFTNQKLYDALIDSFSMRAFVSSAGVSGHDQFFATFGRFNGVRKTHHGEWLDELATRAAAQNEQYLEIMHTPDFAQAIRLAANLQWTGDPAATREALLKDGLRDNIAVDRAEIDAMERGRNEIEHCGTPSATPGCRVKIRYLFQVLRAFGPEQVFAQTLLGFELASVDPRVVGINFVQPEDAYMAMSQYRSQMDMLHYLRAQYPKVHLSLHAGELAPGLVSPEGLRFHIREAVERAGAERIGHGVDIGSETDADGLLGEMHTRHIAVEINLTSNDVILGVSGAAHPLSLYRSAGVPFALSTDDEGVSRIDLTNEYVRAVTEQHMDYAALKQSARTSLEHSFLPGDDLFSKPDTFATMVNGCARPSTATSSQACTAFLHGSEKASEQYELERRFAVFEAAAATR